MRIESGLTSNLESVNELIGHLPVDSLQDILGGIDDTLRLVGGGCECAESVWRACGLVDEADWLRTCEERHFDGSVKL